MEFIEKGIPLWKITIWDKRFNNVDNEWQPKTIKYNYLLSDELNSIKAEDGDVRILYTGKEVGYTTEKLAGQNLSEGEIVSIPWGGIPSVKYHKGKFVTGDNRIATSSDVNRLTNKYLYYFLRGNIHEVASYYRGASLKHPNMKDILKMKISFPSIDIQEKICTQLDILESIIALRQKELLELDKLIRARFVEMFCNKGYPVLGWNEVFNTTTGKLDSNAMVENGDYPFFTCAKEVFRIDKYAFEQEALILAGNNAAGKYDVKYYKGKFNAYQRTYILSLKQDWSYRLFQYQLEDKLVYLQQQSLGGLTKYLTLKILGDLSFIIPPIDQQTYFEKFVEQVNKSKLLAASQPQIRIYKTLTLL